VLRAADHFRTAALHDGRRPDDRLADAVDLIRAARDADGTWHQQLRHEGRTWSDVDSGPGEASRWLTFHALRVLTWWDTEPPVPPAPTRSPHRSSAMTPEHSGGPNA
jgi:hypothetical protein